MFERSISKDNLHHAYVIAGPTEKVLPNLFSFLENCGIACTGNPDVLSETYDTFGVGESRELKRRQAEHAVMNDIKIFIISVKEITVEAQQALLKVFEEPAPGVHFFLIYEQAQRLLPTLLSRVEMILVQGDEDSTAGKAFLSLSSPQRLKHIASLVKKHEGAALKEVAREIIDGALLELREDTILHKESLQELLRAKEYVSLRGGSVKMVLEHLALSLPFRT